MEGQGDVHEISSWNLGPFPPPSTGGEAGVENGLDGSQAAPTLHAAPHHVMLEK